MTIKGNVNQGLSGMQSRLAVVRLTVIQKECGLCSWTHGKRWTRTL